MRSFGAGGRPYDWRDDPEQNPDYQRDMKMYKTRDARTYTTPYSGNDGPVWIFSHP